MKRPETKNKQYWDGDRFRYLLFIEHLEDYTNELEKQLKNCNLQNVSQQRELLFAFGKYLQNKMQKKMNLSEYLSMNGKIENLNLNKTSTSYYDKYQGLSISSISLGRKTNPSFGNPNGVQLYSVNYTNGSNHEYSPNWIETEVELKLDDKYIKCE